MISETTKAELKQKLEAEKKRLEKNLASAGERDPHAKENWDAAFPNMGEDHNASSSMLEESADEVEEYDRRLETEEVQEERYQDVLRALAKFETGTYGLCEICGQEIPEERLRANPAARADIEHGA